MENPHAAELATYLNRLITEGGDSDVSLSLFYGIINVINKELTFVNAGHSPPILFKSRTKEVINLARDEILLGEAKNPTLKEKHVSMDMDDILVFHTDGVNSVVNEYGEHFKTVQLIRILEDNHRLTPEELIGKLKDSIESFSNGSTLKDDITLIVLKIN